MTFKPSAAEVFDAAITFADIDVHHSDTVAGTAVTGKGSQGEGGE